MSTIKIVFIVLSFSLALLVAPQILAVEFIEDTDVSPTNSGIANSLPLKCETTDREKICLININPAEEAKKYGPTLPLSFEIPIKSENSDSTINKSFYEVNIPLGENYASNWSIFINPQMENIPLGYNSNAKRIYLPGNFAWRGDKISVLINMGTNFYIPPSGATNGPVFIPKNYNNSAGAKLSFDNGITLATQYARISGVNVTEFSTKYNITPHINVYALSGVNNSFDGRSSTRIVGFQFTTEKNPQNEKYMNFFGSKMSEAIPLQGTLLNP